MIYTFRLIAQYQNTKLFECCKWSEDKEPIDVYTIRVKTRSRDCNCWAHGPCFHIDLVDEVIAAGLENELHHYIWSRDNTWQFVEDMIDA